MTDPTFHGIELSLMVSLTITIIATCVKVIRTSGKVETVIKNFPPHRHLNGDILYPDGMEPPPIHTMFHSKTAGGD